MKKALVEAFLSDDLCSDAETWSRNIIILAFALGELAMQGQDMEEIGIIFGRVIGNYAQITNDAINEIRSKMNKLDEVDMNTLASKMESDIDLFGSAPKSSTLLDKIEEDIRKIELAVNLSKELPALKKQLEKIRHKWLFPNQQPHKAA